MKRFSKMRRTLAFLLLLPLFGIAHGQVMIKGSVSSTTDGSTLPGVNIVEKGTTNGTISDLDGNYSIEVSGSDAVLVYSSIGFISKEIPVGNQTSINATLDEDITSLDEIVVVGYGGIKRKELTGAVASVNSESILRTASSDLNSALQGQMAGVSVQASSGAPGSQANIQIRGIGSFSASSVNPLYVIDGIPYDGVPNITPEEIETIDVSKDGATAAVYGTRASNGVIQITTKKGSGGKMKVNLTSYYGVQNITSGIALTNTERYIFVDDTRGTNNGFNGTSIFVNYPDALETDNDFQDYIMVDNAPMMSHTISVSGGSEDANMFMTTTYKDVDGTIRNSGYKSLSTRLNGTIKKNKFSAFSSLSLKYDNTERAPWGIYEESVRQKPFQSLPSDENETEILDSNPIFFGSFAQRFSDRNISNSNTTNASVNLKYEIIEGLFAEINTGLSFYNYRRKFWEPQYFITNSRGEINSNASRMDARLQQRWVYRFNWSSEAVLTYRKSLAKHNFTATAGYSLGATNRYEEIGRKEDFISNETQVFTAGNTILGLSGLQTQHRIQGTIGRVIYNYDERYMFTGSMRYDGSSNFAPSNRRQPFWGTSLGWNISEEAFFSDLKSIVNSLKIRGSVAEVGNDRIPEYLYTAAIHPGSNYVFGPESDETLSPGSTQRSYPNQAVQWETNFSKNIGLDASLLNGKISFSLDAYHNSKEDMLVPVDISPSAGTWIPRSDTDYRTITQNVGNMINKGIEAELKYQDNIGEFNWAVQGTFSRNVNTVTQLPEHLSEYSLGGGAPILYTSQPEDVAFLVEGEPVPSFMLIPTDGVIKDSVELAEYEAQWSVPVNAQLGDLCFVDTNGDSISDLYDRVPVGSPNPDFEASLNFSGDYKGFDLSVLLFYSHGGKIYNGAKALAYRLYRHEDQYYQWSPANTDSEIPSVRVDGNHRNIWVQTDQFLEDATYLRVRNVTLGYSLPKKWLSKVKIEKLRAYVTLQNPLTFTKYTGFDPEVGFSNDDGTYNGGGDALFSKGVDRGNYPVARQYLAGIQVGF